MTSGVSADVLSPERLERHIENRDLVMTMDEERAARVIHVVAPRDLAPCGRAVHDAG